MLPTCVRMMTAVVLIASVWGCSRPTAELQPYQPPERDYAAPLPPGALALRKIGPEAYPDFGAGFHDQRGLREAIRYSLDYLAKPSSEAYYPYAEITHDQVVASLRRFLDILDEVDTPQALDAAIRREFDVYQSVGCDGRGTVFFTGYYTPIFDGRKERSGEFRYPLYGTPPDLVRSVPGGPVSRRRPDGGVDPSYPTRRQIESTRMLDGHEVAWLRTPFEAYVITVQGSAKLRLADGSFYELGYAGDNGHEYTPIAAAMVQDGVIKKSEISLQTLLAYFSAHPEQVHHYAWQNDRYVFFQPTPGGARGSLNTPVTAYRTLATDKEVFPRAALTFVRTDLPRDYNGTVRMLPYGGFGLDQDTGGAIRAAGRSDIYMGVGPGAEALAGRTGAEGALYYLFLKPSGSSD